jgi:hypothetical protein
LGYFSDVAAQLIGRRVDLPRALVDEYPQLNAIRLRRGGILPRIAGWTLAQSSVSAITLWRTVFLGKRARVTPELLLHEFRHTEQFLERRTFPLRYIWESLRRGYHWNRYEVDARDYASERLAQSAFSNRGRTS